MRRTRALAQALGTLCKEIPSWRLALPSAKPRLQLRFAAESAVRVTSVTNSERNATGSIRALIALVGFHSFSDAGDEVDA